MVDIRQSKEYARYLESIGWVSKKINNCYVYIREIPLTPFSIIKVQRPQKIPFENIEKLARKYRAFQVTIEPNNDMSIYDKRRLQARGYHLSKSPFLPTKTIYLDLAQSEEKILAQMKKDARYEIRKAKEIEIELLSNQAIKKFHQAWKKSVSWNRWVPSQKSLKMLKKAFGKNAIFLVATPFRISYIDISYKDILAGTVILIAGKTAYYYYAFSSKEGRKKSAQYLLVWEVIKLAKRHSCKIFDFEGIYDERFPIKAWKGFSHFKKSFGGEEIEYPGCLIKLNRPILNFLASIHRP